MRHFQANSQQDSQEKKRVLKLTASIPDLHTSLTNVNGNDFAHFFSFVECKELYRNAV
jgi:hypothetical protein